MKKLIITFATSMMLLNTAHATDIASYRSSFSDSNSEMLMTIYLNGIANGFTTANGYLMATGQNLMYCAPENFSMNSNNIRDAIEHELTNPTQGIDHGPNGNLSIIAMFGMRNIFPCE